MTSRRLFAHARRKSAAALVLTAVTLGISGGTAAPALAAAHVTFSDGDDANLMRVTMNAERAERVRALAHEAVNAASAPEAATAADARILSPAESRARKVRALERKVLSSPVYVAPVNGPITQWYGYHPGIDIAPAYGTPVRAAHSGVVTFVGWEDGYGMHVEVAQADGYVTTYSHMSAWTVQEGQLVVAGQQLGNVGSTGWSTGPHLHFEVHLPNGQRTDPALWLFAHGIVI